MKVKTLTVAALALGMGVSGFSAETAQLKHRYSFAPDYSAEDPYVLTDSVGTAHGKLYGVESYGSYLGDYIDPTTGNPLGSAMYLTAQGTPASMDAGSFAALPAGIIKGMSSFSIETWVMATKDNGNWMRIYDFGSNVLNEDGTINTGGDYTFMTWRSYDGTLRAGIRLNGDEKMVDAPTLPIADDVFHHIVYTYDSETQTGKIYCDGQFTSQGAQAYNPTQLGEMPNMWLGKAQFADPYFAGTYAEFRIYQGVLTTPQIAMSNQAGAWKEPAFDPGTFQSLALTPAQTLLYVNERTALSVDATYSLAGIINVASDATVVSTDPEVVQVVNSGVIRGLKPGKVTLTVSYEGKEATCQVEVTDQIPEVKLDHRYSFASDAKDSVGGANGELRGGASVSGGKLVLAPASKALADSQYVKLPPGMLANYMSVSIETWAQIDNVDQDFNNCRFWEFANSAGGEDVFDSGTQAFYLTPRGSTVINSRLWTPYTDSYATGTGNQGSMTEGVEAHFVMVADGISKTLTLYRDGNLLAQVENMDSAPKDMGWTLNNLIGRSVWAADPGLPGKINEVRIWNGALSLDDVRVSYASGPDVLPTEKGPLQSLKIVGKDNKTEIVEGANLSFSVYADYQNIKNVLLDLHELESITSSDETVLGVDIDNAKWIGVAPGKATVTASLDTILGSTTVTVTARPASVLTHRYSFETDASDSVGGADGTLYGTAVVENGALIINGNGATSGQADTDSTVPYAQLPANLISDHESITLETWVQVDTQATWARILDFGNKKSTSGTTYMFIAPYNGTLASTSANFVTTGQGAGEQSIYKAGYVMPFKKQVHLTLTLFADADLGRIYVDGILIGEVPNITNNPKVIGPMAYCYLGRAMYASDPILTGSIDEFRTWKGALTPLEVAVNATLGANTLSDGNLGEFQGIHIESEIPFAAPGTLVPFHVYADYANIKNVPFNSMDGVEITFDNPTFSLVNNRTYTSTAVGSAKLTVSFEGKEYSIPVNASEVPAELVHRYSFEGDCNDSVGTAHGSNWGLAIENGQLIMDGANPVVFEPGILSEVAGEAMTFESWMDINANVEGNWGSFNMSFFNENVAETAYNSFALGLQPAKGGSSKNNSTWALIEVPAEGTYPYYKVETFAPKGFPGVGLTHVAMVVDPVSKLMKIYINGRLENQVTITLTPERLAETLPLYTGWLGCSRANVGLPGKMSEFRIWKGAMTTAQVAASCAAGPDRVADAKALDSLSIYAPAEIIVGAATPVNVYLDYPNVEHVLATDSASVFVTSSNEEVVKVDSQKRLVGIAPGEAQITASFEGKESLEVTVKVLPAQTKVVHRYSFDNGDVDDSVGIAHGFLSGPGASIANGELVLDGANQHAFAQLPAGIVSGLDSLSWEIWFTPGTYIADWNRLLDFGQAAPDGNRNSYLFLSIYTGGTYFRGATYEGGETYRDITLPKRIRDYEGEKLHLVMTYDSEGQMVGYLNGVLLGNSVVGTNTRHLSSIIDQKNYIGRSMYITDPTISLSVDEFRIWNGVLDAKAVAANYAAGPNEIPSGEDVLESITISVPNPEFYTIDAQNSKVIGHYSQAGDVDITAEVELTSDTPAIVSTTGTRVQAVAPGTGKVSVNHEGVSASLEITVLDTAYSLEHRYSFDEAVKDSVGGADGTLYGSAAVADGVLSLDGSGDTGSLTDGCFAALPGNIMSSWPSYTIETWALANADNEYWGRLFDFGNCSIADNRISQGLEYTMIAWNADRHVVKYNGTETLVQTTFPARGTGVYTHIVYVYNSVEQKGYLYFDGVLKASNAQTGDPTTFVGGMPNMWLGKSNWPDPYFRGAYEEFRLWKGVISSAQLQANFEAGPEKVGEVSEVTKLSLSVYEPEVQLGSGLTATVIATYATTGDVDVTKDVTLVPADPEVLSMSAPGVLKGLKAGTTTVTVTFEGKLSNEVEVTVLPDPFSLNYRYSFLDGMTDSISGADGTLYGQEKYGTKIEEGILTLTGQGDRSSLTDGSFAALPADIMSTYANFSIETWATATSDAGIWTRLYDFGSCVLTEDGKISGGNNYTMLSWRSGNSDALRSGVRLNGAEDAFNGPVMPIGDGIFHHVVYTYDWSSQTGTLYVDGEKTASNTQRFNPTQFGPMPNMWLGKANWGDPYFAGKFEEFRIYKGILSADQVSKNFTAGPDVPPGPVGGEDLSWEISSDKLILSWTKGSLEVAPTAQGPWEAINAASPYEVELSGEGGFYRLIQ